MALIAKKRLKQVVKALIQYAHRLRGLSARKKIANDALRQSFIDDGEQIRPDAEKLKKAPVCADDA